MPPMLIVLTTGCHILSVKNKKIFVKNNKMKIKITAKKVFLFIIILPIIYGALAAASFPCANSQIRFCNCIQLIVMVANSYRK